MFGVPNKKLRTEVWYFLISILIVHLAAYLIVPIFPILLMVQKSLSTAEVAIVIGAGSLFIQLGSIVSGLISDRFGNKSAMLISNGCQAVALACLGFFNDYPWVLLFSILNGVGTGMYIPSTKAALTYMASKDTATTVFSLRSIASHIGISISGFLILFFSTNANFYYAAAAYVFLFVFSWIYLPSDCGDQPCPALPLRSYINILKDTTFIYFALLCALIWGLHTQLAFLLPLRGEAILDNPSRIGIIWTIASISVILLQQMISKGFLDKAGVKLPLIVGSILIGGGISLIGLAEGFYLLVICGLIFILGEMMVTPTIDSFTSLLANPKLIGAYFAVANFSAGIGGGVGTYASGKIIEAYGIKGTPPWFIYGGYAIAVVILLNLYSFSHKKK